MDELKTKALASTVVKDLSSTPEEPDESGLNLALLRFKARIQDSSLVAAEVEELEGENAELKGAKEKLEVKNGRLEQELVQRQVDQDESDLARRVAENKAAEDAVRAADDAAVAAKASGDAAAAAAAEEAKAMAEAAAHAHAAAAAAAATTIKQMKEEKAQMQAQIVGLEQELEQRQVDQDDTKTIQADSGSQVDFDRVRAADAADEHCRKECDKEVDPRKYQSRAHGENALQKCVKRCQQSSGQQSSVQQSSSDAEAEAKKAAEEVAKCMQSLGAKIYTSDCNKKVDSSKYKGTRENALQECVMERCQQSHDEKAKAAAAAEAAARSRTHNPPYAPTEKERDHCRQVYTEDCDTEVDSSKYKGTRENALQECVMERCQQSHDEKAKAAAAAEAAEAEAADEHCRQVMSEDKRTNDLYTQDCNTEVDQNKYTKGDRENAFQICIKKRCQQSQEEKAKAAAALEGARGSKGSKGGPDTAKTRKAHRRG